MNFLQQLKGRLRQGLISLLERRGYCVTADDYLWSVERFLNAVLAARGSLYFVQIGANNGLRNDPLHGWIIRHAADVHGLVVEPLPDMFEELTRTYQEYPSIVPVRTAIHNTAQSLTLYRVTPQAVPSDKDWMHGIASFSREHLLNHGAPPEAIVEEEVPCMTFSALMDRHPLPRMDLLQVDTEGMDMEIIRAIDFPSDRRPAIIRCEHHLSEGHTDWSQFHDFAGHLHSLGYEILLERHDLLAYKPEVYLQGIRG